MTKQKDPEGFWTHFILEAYCLYYEMKDKHIKVTTSKNAEEFLRNIKKNDKDIEWKIIKNNLYKPGRKKPKKCKDPGCPSPDKCLANGKMCPYFSWTSVEKKEYQAMIKAWKKIAEQIEKDET